MLSYRSPLLSSRCREEMDIFRNHNDSKYDSNLRVGSVVVRLVDTGRTVRLFPVFEEAEEETILAAKGVKRVIFFGSRGGRYHLSGGVPRKIGGSRDATYRAKKE
jgi:hypothetical protein